MEWTWTPGFNVTVAVHILQCQISIQQAIHPLPFRPKVTWPSVAFEVAIPWNVLLTKPITLPASIVSQWGQRRIWCVVKLVTSFQLLLGQIRCKFVDGRSCNLIAHEDMSIWQQNHWPTAAWEERIDRRVNTSRLASRCSSSWTMAFIELNHPVEQVNSNNASELRTGLQTAVL